MRVQFVGQGLPGPSMARVGDLLRDALRDPYYTSFTAYAAYVSIGVARQLAGLIGQFVAGRPDRRVALFVGGDLEVTTIPALEALLDVPAEVRVIRFSAVEAQPIIYHPKTYVFRGETNLIIVGSSNMTTRGWERNVENSVVVTFDEGDPEGAAFLAEIESFYAHAEFDQHAQLLDRELIALFKAAELVVSAEPPPAKPLVELSEAAKQARKELQARFPGITVSKQPGQAATADPSGAFPTAIPGANRFWCETQRMTGASGNQLDLSKTAKRRRTAPGSVHLFGWPPPNVEGDLSVSLDFGGRIFHGNRISYFKGNGMWRLLMLGVAADGTTMPDVVRQQLNNKVLVFTATGEHHYRLDVQDGDTLERLKAESRFVDENQRGGASKPGRWWGVLEGEAFLSYHGLI